MTGSISCANIPIITAYPSMLSLKRNTTGSKFPSLNLFLLSLCLDSKVTQIFCLMFGHARPYAQFQKISILPPPSQKGLEFPGGGGFYKTKNLKCMKLIEISRGVGGGKIPSIGGMDSFWNYTMKSLIICTR